MSDNSSAMETEASQQILEPWQEPVRGRWGDPALFTVPGLEALRIMLTGGTPAAPISRLTGLRLTSVGAGTTTWAMPATEWLLGPKGRIHTGMLAFLSDAPLGSVIASSLPARTPFTTAELSMTFLGEPPRAAGNLIGQGKLIYADERNALSEVFVTDADGRLVAHGTSRCFIFPQIQMPESIELSAPEAEPDYDTPDPFERPVLFQESFDAPAGMSGLDLMCAAVRGDVPLPPIDHLTGIRPVEAQDGRVVFTMPASGWLTNAFGSLYGGVIACLAKSAASGAVQTIAPAGTEFTALDVKVNYLRPGVVGAGELIATGTVIHRGRSLAIARAEVVQDGKQVAVATGSTSLRS